MENKEIQNLLLNLVQERVSDEFGLDQNYALSSFNAKAMSVALTSKNFDITVKCKSDVAEMILQEYFTVKRELEEQLETENQK